MRVIKQIIAMFFSVNGDQFRQDAYWPIAGLATSESRREGTTGPELGSTPTSTGWVDFDITQSPAFQISYKGQVNVFSEIILSSFGYVMTLGAEALRRNGYSISRISLGLIIDETRTEFLETASSPNPPDGRLQAIIEILTRFLSRRDTKRTT